MTETDRNILACWDAKMSTASIAAMFGRSQASVDRRLAQLREDRRAAEMGRGAMREAPAPKPFPQVLTVPAAGLVALARQAAVRADPSDYRMSRPPPAPAPKVERRPYNPVGPRKLRFCRWFLEAGWRLAEVANLFDVEPADLAEAVGA